MIISIILLEVPDAITDPERNPNPFGIAQDPYQSVHAYTLPRILWEELCRCLHQHQSNVLPDEHRGLMRQEPV